MKTFFLNALISFSLTLKHMDWGWSLVHDDPGSSSQNHPTMQRDSGCTFGGSDAAHGSETTRHPSASSVASPKLPCAWLLLRATRVSRRQPTTADPAAFTTIFQREKKKRGSILLPWMRPRTTTLEREVSELGFRYLRVCMVHGLN